MSHLLAKKGNKYNVWTTIADGWLFTKWLTEAELRSCMAKRAEQDYKKKLIRDLWLFPHGWHMKDGRALFAEEGPMKACNEWDLKLCACETEEEYDRMLDEKLKELTKDLPNYYDI